MWLCSCVTFTCACVGATIVAVAMIQKVAKKNFIFHLVQRHRAGPMLYRDLSVNTDAALQEVARKISEQVNSLIWFRDDHIHASDTKLISAFLPTFTRSPSRKSGTSRLDFTVT